MRFWAETCGHAVLRLTSEMLVLEAADRDAIREVLARYCWHLDHCEWDEWLNLFTPDGSWGAEGARAFEGRAAMVKLANGLAKKRINAKASRHFITNELIETVGDQARLRCYLAVIRVGSKEIGVVGEFDVRLTSSSGGWLIQQLRFLAPDEDEPAPSI